jgi:phosphoribosylformimino-5-aminoimidazole carboxamide ribotide isomerase
MRDQSNVRAALELGLDRVVIGTRAAESMSFVKQLVASFGSERIAVGVDAHEGNAAVKGWTEPSEKQALSLAREADQAGVGAVIYTDIATDGMLSGPNFADLAVLLGQLDCPLIASGGISTAADVRRLADWPELHGAIIGRALYEGTLRLADCVVSG